MMDIKLCFFFNDTATTEIYTLSLHDALPISARRAGRAVGAGRRTAGRVVPAAGPGRRCAAGPRARPRAAADLRQGARSEEHTSELQSRQYLVCRLLLEKKQSPRYITSNHQLR